VDNGPEFAGKVLDVWAYLHGVTVDFSRAGKPTGTASSESFNDRGREECLNQSYSTSVADAQPQITSWRVEYSERRHHSALSELAPGPASSQHQRPGRHSARFV